MSGERMTSWCHLCLASDFCVGSLCQEPREARGMLGESHWIWCVFACFAQDTIPTYSRKRCEFFWEKNISVAGSEHVEECDIVSIGSRFHLDFLCWNMLKATWNPSAAEHPGSPETDCHWSLDGSRPMTAACADSEAEHGGAKVREWQVN